MSMYRLHIDIPIPLTEEDAIKVTNKLISLLNVPHVLEDCSVDQINYRLGHDDDRQKSNYMIKNENGHVTNKKSKIILTTEQDVVE
jgi:hypothetical protein